jgi:hypothetical protein
MRSMITRIHLVAGAEGSGSDHVVGEPTTSRGAHVSRGGRAADAGGAI